MAEVRQRHVDVANIEIDDVQARLMRRIPSYIALALPVPDQP
jgi:hypothetical protein